MLLAAAVVAGATALAKAPAISLHSVARDTITNPDIHVPESFETDVHRLMHNWYMQNYAVLDKNTPVPEQPATDEDYVERLQRMNTVIDMPYNKIVRAFINMYAERKKPLVEAMLGMSLYYMPIFEQALDREGLPMELKYLPVIESALNPNAVSKAGATGIWQFMTSTATGEGLEVNSVVDERRDPYRASEAAARYLRKLHGIYGDWSLAIAAYNCGPGNVNKALRRAGGGKKDFWEIYRFLPAETRDYIPAFIAANYIMTNYDKHGISPVLAARPILTDSVHVRRRVHFEQISEVMDIPMDELRILNPQYRTDVIPGDVRPYPLVLPNLQVYSYIVNEDSIVNHNAEKYARREVVEPTTEDRVSANGRGEYVQELVVKYHKVRRGETLAKIARKYGVSQAEIKRTNRIGNKVRRGQTLKINTYRRRFIPAAAEVPADSTQTGAIQQPDSIQTGNPTPVSEAPDVAPERPNTEVPVKSVTPKTESRRRTTEAKPVTHTIARGENLGRIAAKYGVTVEQLRKANNIKGDNIKAGDKLTIPAKSSSASKSSSKSKSRKSRRRR